MERYDLGERLGAPTTYDTISETSLFALSDTNKLQTTVVKMRIDKLLSKVIKNIVFFKKSNRWHNIAYRLSPSLCFPATTVARSFVQVNLGGVKTTDVPPQPSRQFANLINQRVSIKCENM